MSFNFSFDHLRNEVHGEVRPRPEPETPFRILVMGDFSGRANRKQTEPLINRPARKADIDSFETLMTEWKTRLGLRVGTEHAFAMGFAELEHFHPDALFERVEHFAGLRALRGRLTNPKTSAAAAEEVRGWKSALPSTAIEAKPAEAASTPESEFESLLGGSRGQHEPVTSSAVDAIIRGLIAPHIVPAAEPDLDDLIALVDQAISDHMRSVLHDPDFADMESNWRALHTLITGLELDEELELFVIDISREELENDIRHDSARGLTEILVERTTTTAGAKPWSVVCLLESFAASAVDAHLVGSLAMCAHAGGTVILAGAHDTLAGVDSIASNPRPENWNQSIHPEAAAHWQLVRTLPESGSIGLVLPRVLSRLPYSRNTDPVDAFDFEESPAGSPHESLPWANAATYCTLLLGRAYTERGWSLDLQAGGDVDGLPVYVAESGPDRVAMPCAEAWLTDGAAQRLLEKGLIPVLSVQHRDAIRIPRMTAVNGAALVTSWA